MSDIDQSNIKFVKILFFVVLAILAIPKIVFICSKKYDDFIIDFCRMDFLFLIALFGLLRFIIDFHNNSKLKPPKFYDIIFIAYICLMWIYQMGIRTFS